jgi:hypothetical protein
VFSAREHGCTKVRIGRASWQVLRNAIALNLTDRRRMA